MTIGEIIKKYRKINGVSQCSLATSIDMERSKLTKVEIGTRGLQLKEYLWIRNLLKIPYREFENAFLKEFPTPKLKNINYAGSDIVELQKRKNSYKRKLKLIEKEIIQRKLKVK